MRTYVLIGGIGSGKSTVSAMLEQLGARCIDLDAVGHEVLAQPETAAALAGRFGSGVLDAQGSVDRRKLAQAAFASAEATRALNGITQPRIVAQAMKAIKQARLQGCQVAVVEISPYEGPGGVFDPLVNASRGVVAVLAPESERVRRAVRRGMDPADVRNRISRQASDAQRREWADFTLDNGGSEGYLREQVESLWSQMAGGESSVTPRLQRVDTEGNICS